MHLQLIARLGDGPSFVFFVFQKFLIDAFHIHNASSLSNCKHDCKCYHNELVNDPYKLISDPLGPQELEVQEVQEVQESKPTNSDPLELLRKMAMKNYLPCFKTLIKNRGNSLRSTLCRAGVLKSPCSSLKLYN